MGGIGGLGFIAIRMLKVGRCNVTAISSNAEKRNEPRMFGASHFFSSRNPNSLEPFSKGFDMVLVAKNVELDWDMCTLAPSVLLYI